ncbi:MAG: glycosyltransferase family 87 protein, partial [Methylocella sp.]
SYGGALLAWLSLTSGAAIACLRRWSEGQIGWIAILTFPALWVNAGNGQNGGLTTALLGTGFLVLPGHPMLAGLAFGGLAIKPQLGVALPFALIAARRWRPICAAGVTSIGLSLLATAIFGTDIWRGFLTSTSIARAVLEQNALYEKMPTIFAAARLYGAPLSFAYGAQAITALTALGFLVRCVRRHRPDALALGAVTVAATVLVSPYLLDYDLSVIGLPLAWLSGRGLVHGFLPYEKFGILAAFALPLISRVLCLYLHLAAGPIVLATQMCLVARRISIEAAKA